MKTQRVLITGATGLLGAALAPYLRNQGHDVVRHGHAQAADVKGDLIDQDDAISILRQVRPDAIINLAAHTDVDGCESDRHRGYLLNTKIAENLAEAICQQNQRPFLIQVSTDQVYDDSGANSEDKVRITNHYAMTKLAGELAARRVDSTVLRTNFFGKSSVSGRSSFTDWIHAALSRGDTLNGFTDVSFSPLAIDTLVGHVDRILSLRPIGVFNLGSRDGLSKYEFMKRFAQLANLPVDRITPMKSSESMALKAYRPKNMCMNSEKIESVLGLEMPTLDAEIRHIARIYG